MKKQFKRAILAAGMMVMLSATTGISALATQTNNINGQTARASVPLVQPPKVQIPGGDAVLTNLTVNSSFTMIVTDASKTATWVVKQGNTVLKTSAQAGWSMTSSPYMNTLKIKDLGITKAGRYTLTVSNSKSSVIKHLPVK